jgi:hypothetical protein
VIADEAAAGRHFAALRSMPYLLAVDVFSGDGRLLASATPGGGVASAALVDPVAGHHFPGSASIFWPPRRSVGARTAGCACAST